MQEEILARGSPSLTNRHGIAKDSIMGSIIESSVESVMSLDPVILLDPVVYLDPGM